MKTKSTPTDFARCITRFLTIHLPGERNLSPQTIKSYSFALKMYIGYLDFSAGIKPERIELRDVSADKIMGFLVSMGELSPKNSQPAPFSSQNFRSLCNAGIPSLHT